MHMDLQRHKNESRSQSEAFITANIFLMLSWHAASYFLEIITQIYSSVQPTCNLDRDPATPRELGTPPQHKVKKKKQT